MAVAKNPDFSIGTHDTPDTLVSMNDYVRKADLNRAIDTFEKTTFSQATNTKQVETGLLDVTIPIEGLWSDDVDEQVHNIIFNGTEVSYQLGPLGNQPGKLRYYGKGVITNYSETTEVGQQITFSAEFHVNKLERGVYGAGGGGDV